MMIKIGVCVVLGTALVLTAYAGDWPQFCGPDRNNISTETGLADSWPAEGPKVLWETEVHNGYSGPAIKEGKVYLIDREGENSLLRCLDLSSGKELWIVSFSDPGKMKGKKYAGTRGTPAVTDDAVYLVTGYGTFACIDLKTRNVAWQHNLLEEYDSKLNRFGFSQSPVVYGNKVLIAPHTDPVGVAAYDKDSGKRIWTSPGLGKYAFVSPCIANLCGQDMAVVVGSMERKKRNRGRKKEEGDAASGEAPLPTLMKGHVRGLSLKDGSILWDYAGWQCSGAIPHPTVIPGNRLFITGGYEAGSAMIQIEKGESGLSVKELFATDEVGSQMPQPVLVNQHFYIVSNSNTRNDGLACFGLDGKLAWRSKDVEGSPNFERGPILFADGKLIILDGKTGILYLVRPDVSGYQELAAAKMVEKNDMTWAPPALSDGKLLIRDWNTLKCVDLK